MWIDFNPDAWPAPMGIAFFGHISAKTHLFHNLKAVARIPLRRLSLIVSPNLWFQKLNVFYWLVKVGWLLNQIPFLIEVWPGRDDRGEKSGKLDEMTISSRHPHSWESRDDIEWIITYASVQYVDLLEVPLGQTRCSHFLGGFGRYGVGFWQFLTKYVTWESSIVSETNNLILPSNICHVKCDTTPPHPVKIKHTCLLEC